jgi:hypothetical protein
MRETEGLDLAAAASTARVTAARRPEPLSWRRSRTPSAFKVTLARNFGMATSYLGIAWFVELRWLTEPGR